MDGAIGQAHAGTRADRGVRTAQIQPVEEVEDLHPELRRNFLPDYRGGLEDGEIHGIEPRPVELVPLGVAKVAWRGQGKCRRVEHTVSLGPVAGRIRGLLDAAVRVSDQVSPVAATVLVTDVLAGGDAEWASRVGNENRIELPAVTQPRQ